MTAWVTPIAVMAWINDGLITLEQATALASDATDAVQSVLERDLAQVSNITETYDSNGTDFILLNHWPIVSVSRVMLHRQTVLPASYQQQGWLLDPVNTRRLSFSGYGKLARSCQNITVTYTAGYDLTGQGAPPLPGPIARAILLTAAAMYNAQAADPNLASEQTAGAYGGSFNPNGVGDVPIGARSLLKSFMRMAP